MTLLEKKEGFVSQFGGIDPMEKRKRQRGATSGSGNLSYMHKVEKMTFHQKTFKMTQIAQKNSKYPK
jgi:hypothetical protein